MQLGYGLITCQRYPGDSRTWADLYREAVEMAKLCEEAGLDSVWTSEHHFVDDGYMPSLAVTSAAIAQATGRIEVGTPSVEQSSSSQRNGSSHRFPARMRKMPR